MEVSELQRRIAACIKNEDRQDAEFRYAIFASQAGDLARYISHDIKLSPSARKHGSPAEERLSFGHAFVQLAGLAATRNISLDEAVEAAMKAVEDRDWAKRHAKSTKVEGITAHEGSAEGEVFLLAGNTKKDDVPKGRVLVTRYGGPELVELFGRVIAVITDDGGAHSHLAVLAREHGIPCIMGTGNATQHLLHGQRVRVNAVAPRGFVEILSAP